MKRSKIMFTCRPFAGHYEPLLQIARVARAAGHLVSFASGDPVVGLARQAGFRAFRAGEPETARAEWGSLFPGFTSLAGSVQREFMFTEIFANLELQPRAADLEPLIAAWQPDLVIHEMGELAAPLVATSLGVPYAEVGFGPLVPTGLLEAAGKAAAAHWRARRLDPHPLAGMFRYVYIDGCPPSLQSPDIAAIASVQPMRTVAPAHPATAETMALLEPLLDRPIVYVTMGTVWNSDLGMFRTIIDALHDRFNLIVTVGRRNSPDKLGPVPGTVIVRQFIPQHEVLPHCAAVVCHGGSGTMLGTLAHGVPLLALPQGGDQWTNAERLSASGAGRQLLREEVTAGSIVAAVSELLAGSGYRAAAQTIADEISSMPPPAEALDRVLTAAAW